MKETVYNHSYLRKKCQRLMLLIESGKLKHVDEEIRVLVRTMAKTVCWQIDQNAMKQPRNLKLV